MPYLHIHDGEPVTYDTVCPVPGCQDSPEALASLPPTEYVPAVSIDA
jgi:hypothetical protein